MTLEERAVELAKQDKANETVHGWVRLSQELGLPYTDPRADQLMLAYNTERLRDLPNQEDTR